MSELGWLAYYVTLFVLGYVLSWLLTDRIRDATLLLVLFVFSMMAAAVAVVIAG